MSDASRLKGAADRVVEAGCLAAVLLLPLYFSVLTLSGYESDKAVLLRVLAVLVGAAWIVGFALGERDRATRSSLLLWLALTILLVYCLATILSIDPRLSLWGSQGRQQGLWTRASYLVFLVAVATRLRSRRQRERLVSMLLLGSVPAAVYGVLQQLGYDPIPSGGDPNTLSWPVRSSFGQHIFFASYLVMVIPFSAARLVANRGAWSSASKRWFLTPEVLQGGAALAFVAATYVIFMAWGSAHPALFAVFPGLLLLYVLLGLWLETLPDSPVLQHARLLGYGALLALQLLALAFTGARGAWLGFLAALPVFGFLGARRMRRPGVARGVLAVTLAAGLFLLLLNIPNGPLHPLRNVRGLNRLADITASGGAGGSAQGRLLIWQGVWQLMTHQPAVGGDWGGPLRAIVGYGPESLHWAFESVYPLKLRVVTSEIWTWDRAHNIFLDYLVDAGLLGLLAVLALLGTFLYRAFSALPRAQEPEAWILIAAASAAAGHLVDGFFGIETVVTLLLLWILVGLVAGVSSEPVEDHVAPTLRLPRGSPFWFGLGLAIALIMALPFGDHPAVLAALWLVSLVLGVGAIAALLEEPGRLPRISLSLHGRRLLFVSILAALSAVVLGSQMRFQTAAVADRAGVTALDNGQVVQALGYLEEATQANSYEPKYEADLAGAYLTLGAVRLDSGDPTYVPTTSDVRTIDPAIATSLGKDQLFTLARFALESAQSFSPLDPDTYYNLGNVLLQSGQPEQAMGQFRRAEALSLNNPRYLDQEALAQLQERQLQRAARKAHQALSLDNTFWYSYYTLALVDDQLGARDRARQEATESLAWVHNYWPPPPSQQLAQLQSLQRAG